MERVWHVAGAQSFRGHSEEPVDCSSEFSHQETGKLEIFIHWLLSFFFGWGMFSGYSILGSSRLSMNLSWSSPGAKERSQAGKQKEAGMYDKVLSECMQTVPQEIWLSHKKIKTWNLAMRNDMDGPRGHWAEWKQSEKNKCHKMSLICGT